MSRHTKHLGQTSLGSKGDARSHRHTHIGSIAVPGPLKWPAINAKTMLFVQDRCAKCQHASDVNYDACIRMRSDNGSLLFISEKTDGVPLSTSNNLFFSVHFTAARIPTAIFYSCLSKHLYSATAAAVVQSRQRDPCSLYYFVSFYVPEIFVRVVLCPPRTRSWRRRRKSL